MDQSNGDAPESEKDIQKREFLKEFSSDPKITFKEAAEEINRHRSTVYRWAMDDALFRQKLEQARAFKSMWRRGLVEDDLFNKVQQNNLDGSDEIRFMKFLDEYSDSFELDRVGQSSLTDEEIEEILKGKLRTKLREKGLRMVEDSDGEWTVEEIDNTQDLEGQIEEQISDQSE
jgi:hypothetical protein